MSTLRQQHIDQLKQTYKNHDNVTQNLDSGIECNLNNLRNHEHTAIPF